MYELYILSIDVLYISCNTLSEIEIPFERDRVGEDEKMKGGTALEV